MPNLGQTTLTSYEYEKIESNNIDDTIQNAWDGRNGTKYYIANENPHSQAYHTLENTYFEITTDKNYLDMLNNLKSLIRILQSKMYKFRVWLDVI